MRRKVFVFLFGFLLLGLASAAFCVDHTSPNAPVLTSSGARTALTIAWSEPLDLPDCSGIDYYSVYKNGEFFLETEATSFADSADYGTTIYSVYAFDLAGHESSAATLSLSFSSGGGNSGGSSGSSNTGDGSVIEICSNWTECEDSVQIQICSYGDANVTKARSCEMPAEISKPESDVNIESFVSEPTSGFFRTTGQAIVNAGETIGQPKVFVPLIGMFLLLGVIIFVKRKKKGNWVH
jgi:hypothetical protein